MYVEVIRSAVRKARKEHKCNWCRQTIEKGEKYEHRTLKYDTVYTWKNHIRCGLLYSKLSMNDQDNGDGIDSDIFLEIVREFVFNNIPDKEHEVFRYSVKNIVAKALEILERRDQNE